MNSRPEEDLSNLSMLELFRAEAENQTSVLNAGLLELERGAGSAGLFDSLMRAAHSLKGAARIVNLQTAVGLAHALEDCFVAAQHGRLALGPTQVDTLFQGVDLLAQLSKANDRNMASWQTEHAVEIENFLTKLARVTAPETSPSSAGSMTPADPNVSAEKSPVERAAGGLDDEGASVAGLEAQSDQDRPLTAQSAISALADVSLPQVESPERVVRLTAENLNRLLALAGEALVDSRWLGPYAQSLQRLKRYHLELEQQLGHLRQVVETHGLAERTNAYFIELFRELTEARQFLGDRLQELDLFDRRSAQLSQRLYLEVLRTRMRPFSDGVRRFPRMVRDLARSLGKQIHFEVSGENTQVDRDILERLEAPLAHLLRNAVDHGCESSETRCAAGKPAAGTLKLEARHSAGVLLVTVADDGGGVDIENVRRAIVEKHLATEAFARKLNESELLEFLFLPGFTLKETVTELSGRGFGLDVVQNMIKTVRGTIRLINQPGRGLRVQLQLPLT
ncbi:MAG TPA: ATP-binding protein, partial [Patescibacteria group bacterium]|nr:ATP-binding protein [Patescibacteria group bacterium]